MTPDPDKLRRKAIHRARYVRRMQRIYPNWGQGKHPAGPNRPCELRSVPEPPALAQGRGP